MGSHKVADIHTHYSPKPLIAEELKVLAGSSDRVVRYVRGIPSYTIHHLIHDLEQHLAMMDRAGIDLAILSSAEGMRGDVAGCRAVNDALAEAMQKYPGRFLGMAHTDPLDPAGLVELDRAVRELGLRGVATTSTIQGRGLDDPALLPSTARSKNWGPLCLSTRP